MNKDCMRIKGKETRFLIWWNAEKRNYEGTTIRLVPHKIMLAHDYTQSCMYYASKIFVSIFNVVLFEKNACTF